MTDEKKKTKFVQIACCHAPPHDPVVAVYLYALDEDGCVWTHHKDAEKDWGWRRVSGDDVRFGD